MNKVILVGRLTRDPEVRYSQGAESMAIANYSLAVNRRNKDSEGNSTADFIRCVAFGKNGEFAEKYLKKGTKILVQGRIQTGNYTDKEGKTVYTTDVVVEEHEFVESKGSNAERDAYYDNMAAGNMTSAPTAPISADGFMPIPDGLEEELPFA